MTDVATSEQPSGDGDAESVSRVASYPARAQDEDFADPASNTAVEADGPRFVRMIRSMTWPQAVMIGAVSAYTAYYTQRSLDIHHALGTSSYDSALYDQGLWLLSRFDAPFVTLMGRNLFGDHSSFVLFLLVPFYWIWPSAGVLFFAQSAAIAAGAIPIFLYGRSRLASEWAALLLATSYLIHPAIGWTNLENFHPDSFLGVFVGFAIWAALDRKWLTYAVFVLLALSVKEDAVLVVAPLGVWVALRRDRRMGMVTALGSVAFAAIAMLVVMRSLVGVPTRNGWRIPFGGPRGLIDTALTRPTELFRHLRSDDRPWYVVQMTAPFAWLFARKPAVAAIGALVLLTNILSTYWYQYQIQFHYSLVVVPALSLGTIHALGAIRERWTFRTDASSRSDASPDGVVLPTRHIATGAVIAAALITSYMWSAVPWGRTPSFHGDPSSPWARAGREIIETIPSDAVVAAHYRITPHVAHRREIYQFPTPFRAVLYGQDGNVDGPRITDRAERVEYVVLSADTSDYPYADWLVIESAFDLVDANDYWQLYRRDFDLPLPPEPDAP